MPFEFDLDRMDPRVHGNGFIQVDLDPTHRLHVWGHPDIPRQSVNSPIHDHIFGFTSTCLVGRLVNVVYMVSPVWENYVGAFDLYEAQPPAHGHDSKLVLVENAGYAFKVTPTRTDTVVPGQTYDIDILQYHETFATEPSATVIKNNGQTIQQNPGSRRKPRVLLPMGVQPDNAFNRHAFDRDLLMGIIREVVGT